MEHIEIKLRAMEPEDVDFVMECENDPQSSKWSDYSAPFSRHQLLTYALSYEADPFKAGQIRLIITDLHNSKLGILDLYDVSEKDRKAYVGICIHPDFRHRGYAAAAIKKAKDFSKKQLGLLHLVAKVSTQNVIASQLFINSGFSLLTILPSWHRIGQDFHDFNLFWVSL